VHITNCVDLIVDLTVFDVTAEFWLWFTVSSSLY